MTQLNERIDQVTVELRAEQEEWTTKVVLVDKQIEDLKAQLRAKEEERNDYATRLQSATEEIAKFSTRYSSRLATAESQAASCRAKVL